MSGVRLWISLLALSCFAAGLAAGVLVSEARAGEALRGLEPMGDYRVAVVARFGLEPERERLFSELLRNYQQSIDETRERLLAEHRPELERELAAIGARYQAYIRDHVIPTARRAEFDALSAEGRTIQ